MNAATADIAGVDREIAQTQAQLNALGDQCRQLIQEQGALRQHLHDGFNALARIQAGIAIDAEPALARDLLQSSDGLQRRDRRFALLSGELQALLHTQQALQQHAQKVMAARDGAGQRLQELHQRTETDMADDARYGELQLAAQAAQARADAVARMAGSAQQERQDKVGAYQADPIFMYLHARGFGSPSYRAWPLVRTVDGWLADLCGFDKASRDYATLIELPAYLQQHAGNAHDLAEQARVALQQCIDLALADAGIAPLRQDLQQAQDALAAALLAAQLQREEVDGKQAEVDDVRSWADPDGAALLSSLARALSSKEMDELYRRVEATATDEDDQALERIRQSRARLDEIDGLLREHSTAMAAAKSALGHLQNSRRSYQLASDVQHQAYTLPPLPMPAPRRKPAEPSIAGLLLGLLFDPGSSTGGTHHSASRPAPRTADSFSWSSRRSSPEPRSNPRSNAGSVSRSSPGSSSSAGGNDRSDSGFRTGGGF